MTGQTTFPGGTSVTLLDVYDDAGPDGLRGGTPHMPSGIHGVLRGDRWTRCAAHAHPRRRARDRTGARNGGVVHARHHPPSNQRGGT